MTKFQEDYHGRYIVCAGINIYCQEKDVVHFCVERYNYLIEMIEKGAWDC
ncbi:MAG: hypothetical protein KBA08_02830 [Firmicutes bacterium]|nr:hypothetical protein [Bacillota bacterium]